MPLSPRTLNAVMRQESEDTDIVLITMTHPSWTEPIRLSTHETVYIKDDEETKAPIYGTISRGNTFWFCPLQATVPNSANEQAPEGKFIISNVTRMVAPYLKLVDKEYPRILIEIVNSGTPDVVEMAFSDLALNTATWDANQVEVTVKSDIAASEPAPWLRFSVAYFPNLVQ